jgi:hypothetical protein
MLRARRREAMRVEVLPVPPVRRMAMVMVGTIVSERPACVAPDTFMCRTYSLCGFV